MPEYRRVYVNGGTYFFTVVTYQRHRIFQQDSAVETLNRSFQDTMFNYPFLIDALVVMPDHLHTIWTLPKNDHYIHYNPVKHGLVKSPSEWKFSSFSEYVKNIVYTCDWGSSPPKELLEMNLE
jgi:putative transposase